MQLLHINVHLAVKELNRTTKVTPTQLQIAGQSIFLQHKDVSITTNTIRASYVTHLLSGDDGVPEHVLVQAARAMRHSRKEQCRTYDKRMSSDKVAFAVDLSATQASSALGIAAGPSMSSRKASKKKKQAAPFCGRHCRPS